MFQGNIDNALREHSRLALRSESHGHYQELYVDVDQLETFETPDWQVVYGRRGTGKTLLLGMLNEGATARTKERNLSVLISAPDCKVEPVGRAVPAKVMALGYFQTFLELLIDRVTSQLDDLIAQPSFLSKITGQRRRLSDQAFGLMVELLDLANRGLPIGAYSDITSVKEEEKASRSESSIGVAAQAKAADLPTAGVSAHAKFQRAQQRGISQIDRASSGAVPRFALVRKALQELLRILEIERLTILIDEWSTLDPTGATSIQPEFAEYLKRTFHGAEGITVKIATNRYQTRFSNRGAGGSYRGLELEADIFTGINLDRAVLDRASLVEFYESLLFNRLSLFDSGLKKLRPKQSSAPEEAFILSIFHDRRAFEELVKGAGGVPRDFLALFNGVARAYQHSVETRWTSTQVQDVIRQRSVTGHEGIEYYSVTSQLVDPCIKAVVATTGSRIFFVSKEHHSGMQAALDELLEKRLIHDFPREELPGFARDGQLAYLVDYGTWLDWERTRTAAGPAGPENALPEDPSRLSEWQLDPTQIEQENQLTCPHCGRVFTSDEPSYAVKGLCPECFEPAMPVAVDP